MYRFELSNGEVIFKKCKNFKSALKWISNYIYDDIFYVQVMRLDEV